MRLTDSEVQYLAVQINTDASLPQDIDILCPVKGGGFYCQWVAGHYGNCVLGRQTRQHGGDFDLDAPLASLIDARRRSIEKSRHIYRYY